MKLHELHDIDILWEGEIEGDTYQFIIQEGRAQFVQNSRGGLVRGLAKTAVGLAKNPVIAGLAAGYAIDAFQKYKKNKRTTTTFFAKDPMERKMYQDIIDTLVKSGKFRKSKEQYVDGGYLYVLKRV